MAVTVQMQFASAVTEMSQNAFVGSSIDNGTTISQFDLRQLDVPRELGTTAPLCWRQDVYPGDSHALSTGHKPIKYRCSVAQGYSLHDQKPRVSFTPESPGVSPSQQLSTSLLWRCGSLAVVCGVSRRPMALLFSALCLIPLTKASSQRGMDDMGSPVPPPEDRLRPLLARAPATAGPMDGDSPVGTDHGVMGVQEEHDRLLRTHEAASEQGDEARHVLQPRKDLGLQVTVAVSDDSPSFTEAITAVCPPARIQADPCHTVKKVWGPRKKAL
jgi:hypothetical protein